MRIVLHILSSLNFPADYVMKLSYRTVLSQCNSEVCTESGGEEP